MKKRKVLQREIAVLAPPPSFVLPQQLDLGRFPTNPGYAFNALFNPSCRAHLVDVPLGALVSTVERLIYKTRMTIDRPQIIQKRSLVDLGFDIPVTVRLPKGLSRTKSVICFALYPRPNNPSIPPVEVSGSEVYRNSAIFVGHNQVYHWLPASNRMVIADTGHLMDFFSVDARYAFYCLEEILRLTEGLIADADNARNALTDSLNDVTGVLGRIIP